MTLSDRFASQAPPFARCAGLRGDKQACAPLSYLYFIFWINWGIERLSFHSWYCAARANAVCAAGPLGANPGPETTHSRPKPRQDCDHSQQHERSQPKQLNRAGQPLWSLGASTENPRVRIGSGLPRRDEPEVTDRPHHVDDRHHNQKLPREVPDRTQSPHPPSISRSQPIHRTILSPRLLRSLVFTSVKEPLLAQICLWFGRLMRLLPHSIEPWLIDE